MPQPFYFNSPVAAFKSVLMRYIFLILFFVCFLSKIECQNSLSLNYTFCESGKNTNLLFSKQFNRHRASIGLKYHINTEPKGYPFDDFFGGRFYAKSFWQHIGPVAQYEYIIFPKLWIFQISAFYNIQFMRAPTKHLDAIKKPTNNNYYYLKTCNNLEQFIGLNLSVPINKTVILKAGYGWGYGRLWDLDLSTGNGSYGEGVWDGIASFINFGIAGQF